MNRASLAWASLGAVAAAVGLSACPAPPEAVPPEVTVLPGPEVEVQPEDTTLGRDRRRMDIDQLSASIETVTGGLKWAGLRSDDRFDELAETLGKADYATNTQEDLSPSLLFQKFLDDAAADVCAQAVTREADGGLAILAPTAGLNARWSTEAAAIEADLAAALLRFHGRTFEVGSPELEPWTWLYRTTYEVTQDGPRTWRTVCVGLITHPDFYTY